MQSYIGDNLDSLTNNMAHGFSGLATGGEGGRQGQGQDLVFFSFNQDTTSLAVGTAKGFKLYGLNSSDTLETVHEHDTEEVYIAERLFSSSLVAIVTQAAPRTLKVCHFRKGSEICNFSYSTRILSVRMNRARLVVCLEESLFVHNIKDMTVLHTIRDTPSNPKGLCALSNADDHCYLAYPGHSTIGELQIFDAVNLSLKRVIAAHASQLAAIAFSPSGRRVATASEKGTVIRVFNVTDGSKIYELRRGLKRTVNIFSLSFSPCGQFLACSSNTETVHVFKLDEKPRESDAISPSPPESGASGHNSEGWMSYLNTMVSASASYLPTNVTDTLLQGRAFATVHLNHPGAKNICALAKIRNMLRLLIASSDGFLYLYALNLEEGGDCSLIKQFRIPDEAKTKAGESSHSKDSSSKAMQNEKDASYADRVRNRESSEMTDSEKFHEMETATETPPQQCFLLDDDGEFPPMIPSVQ